MLLSIKSMHVLFITLSISLAFFCGIWGVHEYQHAGGGSFALCMGVGSFAGGVGLIAYLIWFLRKIIRLSANGG